MNKYLKEVLEEAKKNIYRGEPLSIIYIINSGKKYNGFFGKNGYNNIIIIGLSNPTKQTYKYHFITENSDVIYATGITHCSYEISSKTGCVSTWFDEPVKIELPVLSTCHVVPYKL